QQYDSAIAWQNRAIAHFKAIGREDKLALSYNNLASSYLHTSQYPLALTHYLNAIKVAEKNADTSGIITYTGNAGMVYKYMSKYNEAMQHYQKALHLAKAVGNQEYQATYFQKIAIIYDCKDSAGQAIPWYRQAIALNTAIENERALGENFSNIGIAFASLNQPDSAWLYLNKGLPYLRRFGDTRALAVVLKEKAVLLAKAPSGWLSAHGFSPLSAKARAVAMLQEAVAAFEEVDNLFDQSQTWEALYELHKQLGQTGAALVALEHHAQLQDSIFNDGTKEQILSTRLQYEQEIKDAVSKANYEAEIKRQQWNQRAILVVGIGLILAGLVFFALYKRRK
ncbi:MAG TPA: tetratricopeptide repeat protein, partial [Phnomibacter sp.]|nr:tetratricopeptide repeat protein [Phnomibacter sp.]